MLVFPHGKHGEGAYPDPFHEGTQVTAGTKVIIRTDVCYRPVDKRRMTSGNTQS